MLLYYFIYYPPVGGQRGVEISSESAVFAVVCLRKMVLSRHKSGAPAKFALVWPGLNARSPTRLSDILKSASILKVGRAGPI